MYLLKTYIDFIVIFKKATVLFYLQLLTLLSAGPVGNLAARTAPPPGSVAYRKFGWFFYMLQSIFLIPMIALWFWPPLLMLYAIARRVWMASALSTNPHRMSDMSLVLLALLLGDIFIMHFEVLDTFRGQQCFPFIDPFKFFRIVYRSIIDGGRYVINSIMAPFRRASHGIAHYIKIRSAFFRKYGGIIWDKISKAVTNVALAVYRVIKTTLVTLWKAVIVASVQFFKKTVGAVDTVYFFPFSFLLRTSKSLGVLGELIFTIFGLVWLLWPLYATYKLS